jgi:hypothetical protein
MFYCLFYSTLTFVCKEGINTGSALCRAKEVPMEDKKWEDPEEMTPQERWEQMLQLIAGAVVHLIEKEKAAGIEPPPKEATSKNVNDVPMSRQLSSKIIIQLPKTKLGRMPFAERPNGFGLRESHPVEIAWMKQMLEWAKEGESLSKIANRMSKEDRETRYAGKWDRAKVWWVLKKAKRQFTRD